MYFSCNLDLRVSETDESATLSMKRKVCNRFGTGSGARFTGPAQPPEAHETGWKDTVRAHPGMVTRILVPFEGYAGRYVSHCHILEHEDNEMMRPYEVVPR
jgi:FtsP/CotA-like multicopper oxidase with cupredoxin domain